jgi:hypothetical protein
MSVCQPVNEAYFMLNSAQPYPGLELKFCACVNVNHTPISMLCLPVSYRVACSPCYLFRCSFCIVLFNK